jgi:hypothetical protein
VSGGEDEGEADSDDEFVGDAFAQSERLWDSRVHALNLLRHLFADRVFVIEMAPQLGAGFELALSALESPKWDVRNSGTQLVATLLTRAVRTRRNREVRAVSKLRGRARQTFFFLLSPFFSSSIFYMTSSTSSIVVC